MYLLWLLNNLNTPPRALSLVCTVDLSAFVSKLCQSRSQWQLWHNLISICPNRQSNTPGCRGPWQGAVHPYNSARPSAVIQPDLHLTHSALITLGYTYKGIDVGLRCSGPKLLKPPETLLVCWYLISSTEVPLKLKFCSWHAQELLVLTTLNLVGKYLLGK